MNHLKKVAVLLIVIMMLVGSFSMAAAQGDDAIVVGSKDFTEQRFLGYVIYVALQENGFEVVDEIDLGGTAIARGALESGEIDVYPNYTATALIQSLPNLGINVPAGVASNAYEGYAVAASLDAVYNDLIWLRPAPANNTYTIAARADWAEENGLASFEDLAAFVNDGNEVRMISNEEFTTREDGLVTFEETYGFEIPRDNIESLPGAVTAQAHQQLVSQSDQFELAVAYGTDGTLSTFNLTVFDDPRGAQPVYQPTAVFRGEVLRANPQIADILNPIFATFDVETLQTWNSYAGEGVDPDGNPASVEDLARLYLTENGFIGE
jgi:osmoprotectant transport system substrate-binding protein